MPALRQPSAQCHRHATCYASLWQVVAAPLAELAAVDFGPPLHSLILAGDTHVVEQELLAHFRLPSQPDAPRSSV